MSTPWLPSYDALAIAEGWLLSRCGYIERDDEHSLDEKEPTFPDDDAAVTYVRMRAAGGSRMHTAAIEVHDQPTDADS